VTEEVNVKLVELWEHPDPGYSREDRIDVM
jgi:hypothetical protein